MALCNRGKGELGAEACFWRELTASLLLYLAVSPSDSLLLCRTLQLVPAGAPLSVPHPLGGPQSKASIASFWWSQGAWPERSGVQCCPRTCRQPFGKRREDILGIYGGEPFFRWGICHLATDNDQQEPKIVCFRHKNGRCTGNPAWDSSPVVAESHLSWWRQGWWDICIVNPADGKAGFPACTTETEEIRRVWEQRLSTRAWSRRLRPVVPGGAWWRVEVAPGRDAHSCRIREVPEAPQAPCACKDAKERYSVWVICTSVCVGLLLWSLLRLRWYVAGEYVLNCALGGQGCRRQPPPLIISGATSSQLHGGQRLGFWVSLA